MSPILKTSPGKSLTPITVPALTAYVKDALESGCGKAGVVRKWVEKSLFLEVRARTQSASWLFKYTYGGAKRTTGLEMTASEKGVRVAMGFGRWPGVGLAEAREKARAARGLLSQGISPIEEKRNGLIAAKQRARAHTVRDAVEQWLKGSTEALTSPKYAAQKARRLFEVLDYTRKPDVMALGGLSVANARTIDVTNSMDVFLLKGRDARDTYRKVISDLSRAFSFARGKGWRDAANPCEGVIGGVLKPKTKGHRAPELTDLGSIVLALRGGMGSEGFDYDTRLALLLLLTGARTSEVRLAKWSEVVDLDGPAPRIEVPAARMKKRLDWTITLSAQAVSILRELRDNTVRRGDASPLVFYKYKKSGMGVPCHENAVNLVLRRVGLHEQVVGHGFRKLFSTAAYSLWPYRGNNRERSIEQSLAHVNTKTVEETYNLSKYLPERLLLAQWWADHLDMAAAGDAADNVLEFKQAVNAG